MIKEMITDKMVNKAAPSKISIYLKTKLDGLIRLSDKTVTCFDLKWFKKIIIFYCKFKIFFFNQKSKLINL